MPWAAWRETLHDGAQVKKVDYTPEGIEIEAVVDGILYGRPGIYHQGVLRIDEYLVLHSIWRSGICGKSPASSAASGLDTEEEALAKIQEMKKKHYDATHNCWAYIIRDGAVRFSDDGEPGGTAECPCCKSCSGRGYIT